MAIRQPTGKQPAKEKIMKTKLILVTTAI